MGSVASLANVIVTPVGIMKRYRQTLARSEFVIVGLVSSQRIRLNGISGSRPCDSLTGKVPARRWQPCPGWRKSPGECEAGQSLAERAEAWRYEDPPWWRQLLRRRARFPVHIGAREQRTATPGPAAQPRGR